MAERKEATADIRVAVGDETDVVVSQLSLTKNIDIEQLRGSGRTLPDGYAINAIDYEGSMECNGNKKDLESKFFDDNGIPVPLPAITVSHYDGSTTKYQEVLVTSEGYEASEGESTTTSFDFVAMAKDTDTDPTGE